MKTAALERPKTPTTPKPVTDFSERCDNGVRGAWPGIRRLTRVPDAGFPTRKSCQEHVTDAEAEAGMDFVRRYREAEALEVGNNIPALTDKIRRLEAGGFEQAIEAQKLREQLRNMDPKRFIKAIEDLRRLRAEAIEICKPILQRLLAEFDRQLNEAALQREQQLKDMGVALLSEGLDSKGEHVRTWELHQDTICTALQCPREIVRHTILTLSTDKAVGLVQWLCTGEERTPWMWLS